MADYEDQTIRISDLAVEADGLEGKSFERCDIIGPAIVAPSGCRFAGCSFEGDDRALIWTISPEREHVLGAIYLVECSFVQCRFSRIGLALIPPAAAEFLTALHETSAQQQASGEPVAG